MFNLAIDGKLRGCGAKFQVALADADITSRECCCFVTCLNRRTQLPVLLRGIFITGWDHQNAY